MQQRDRNDRELEELEDYIDRSSEEIRDSDCNDLSPALQGRKTRIIKYGSHVYSRHWADLSFFA